MANFSAKSPKPLINVGFMRANSDNLAQKAEKALDKYPFREISPHLLIKINPRAKRMALRVDSKKQKVNLVLPKRSSTSRAYAFALEHKHWIRQKIEEMPAKIHFKDGVSIPMLGKEYVIEVMQDSTLKKTDISLKNNKIIVLTNKPDPSLRIKRFIINHAKERLSALAHEKAALIDKEISKIEVKDTISRWGSCSHDGKLSFSWRLIFAPMEAFDYVVAHEVAHLRVMNHSPDFWHICEDLSVNYSKGKSWMKRHGGELIRYD